MAKHRFHDLKRDERAISPAISSVILTASTVVLLMVTVVFANNFLNARMAENEFGAMKQFMQTTALQIDDVAWTFGRTQTVRYASRDGLVGFEPMALNYLVYVDKGAGYVLLANYSTGLVLFNMPVTKYSAGNGYYKRILPSTDGSFLQKDTSASVCHVFAIEKLPMYDGSFIRVVAAPSIRMLNSTITTEGEVERYFKLYLPILSSGTSPHNSQSITLAGNTLSARTEIEINRIKIQISTPKASLGFDQSFFNFDSITEEIDVPDGSIMQFYTGEVTVSIGL